MGQNNVENSEEYLSNLGVKGSGERIAKNGVETAERNYVLCASQKHKTNEETNKQTDKKQEITSMISMHCHLYIRKF